MAHNHDHGTPNYGKAFLIAIILNISFVVIEGVFGYFSHSLALVADAGHNLSDVLGLVLAWGASALAQKIPTKKRTYGLRRATILASLTNAVVLLVAVGGITWEAITRLGNPSEVVGQTVIWVAAVGILINAASALLFVAGRKKDLNIQGAFIHLAADAGVSLGVVIAGAVILLTGWTWLDPVVSLVIVIVILISTWELLRDSVNLALDAVPEGVNPEKVGSYFENIPGVQEVHDLHIWGMSTTESALTVHLIMPTVQAPSDLLKRITDELHDKFGIEHVTVQIESNNPNDPCKLASNEVV